MGGKLCPVVGADMVGWAVQSEEVGEAMEHIVRVQPALHDHGETSPGELIDQARRSDIPRSA